MPIKKRDNVAKSRPGSNTVSGLCRTVFLRRHVSRTMSSEKCVWNILVGTLVEHVSTMPGCLQVIHQGLTPTLTATRACCHRRGRTSLSHNFQFCGKTHRPSLPNRYRRNLTLSLSQAIPNRATPLNTTI